MSGWTTGHFINIIGLFLGFWLGEYLSRRLKGQALIAAALGVGMVFLAYQLPLPRAYVQPAMAAYSMFCVAGAVVVKDAAVVLWKAHHPKSAGRGATGG